MTDFQFNEEVSTKVQTYVGATIDTVEEAKTWVAKHNKSEYTPRYMWSCVQKPIKKETE